MPNLLFVTDLHHPAKARNYYEEDVFLTGQLRRHFPLALVHPKDLAQFEPSADLIVLRNIGPVAHFPDEYRAFRQRVSAKGLRTYNTFDGKGDMNGKQYLLDLTRQGLPVIPTVDAIADLAALPATQRYVVKPKDGSDSIGLQFLDAGELAAAVPPGETGQLIQPAIDFDYEVSFYFIDQAFQYALYAPDTARRWALERYDPTPADLAFAKLFVDWNAMTHGIQRIDACRAPNGDLLLVEIEDLNPYLSLLDIETETRDRFVAAMIESLNRVLGL